ncbi:hypothetical protein AOXY_G15743 [Acipenser oxyrinchus oxyrinchus]|uniref:Uncharacterized protein n=1 Tax=Acipenser oxyrinchus oxyrinchus TaxID=40147 RepID=A0AAD8D9Q6_ACIOX|nr:hypothetical protein AOXY_G15743 [Acipenser oxyrinchus oxyrinchus]
MKLYPSGSTEVVDEKDFGVFDKIQTDFGEKVLSDIEGTLEENESHFAAGICELKYVPVQSWESLNKTIVNAVMNLVLFEDAVSHSRSMLQLDSFHQIHTIRNGFLEKDM